jgi:hypothetical protein
MTGELSRAVKKRLRELVYTAHEKALQDSLQSYTDAVDLFSIPAGTALPQGDVRCAATTTSTNGYTDQRAANPSFRASYENSTDFDRGLIAVLGNEELAKRGYRTMGVNHHGDVEIESLAVSISCAINYLRTLPGVQKVLVMGHSGGGHLMGFYGNVSLNGPSACNGPEKVYPCDGQKVANLASDFARFDSGGIS